MNNEQLTDRELTERLAKACGWRFDYDGWSDGKRDYPKGLWIYRPMPPPVHGEWWTPTDSLDDVAIAEQVVVERGLLYKYDRLIFEAMYTDEHGYCAAKAVIAPARVRAECCLKVLEGEK